MGAHGGLCGRCDPTPARPSAEGDEALQVLDDGAQGELILHSSEASLPSSPESVPILALGEQVLASDPELATDCVAPSLVDVTDPVAGLGFLHPPMPGPLVLQVARSHLAAASLGEGLDEMVTIRRPGLPPRLRKHPGSTNLIDQRPFRREGEDPQGDALEERGDRHDAGR